MPLPSKTASKRDATATESGDGSAEPAEGTAGVLPTVCGAAVGDGVPVSPAGTNDSVPSLLTEALSWRSRNSIARGCKAPVSSEAVATLTIACGALTIRMPSGLRMSRPVVRSASEPSSRASALSLTSTRQPGPICVAIAPATRSARPAKLKGPQLSRR
jgi:hypothetical protein